MNANSKVDHGEKSLMFERLDGRIGAKKRPQTESLHLSSRGLTATLNQKEGLG